MCTSLLLPVLLALLCVAEVCAALSTEGAPKQQLRQPLLLLALAAAALPPPLPFLLGLTLALGGEAAGGALGSSRASTRERLAE